MPSWQTIAVFMISALALNLTPGPAILFILSRCLGQGRSAAVVSVFGLATASVMHAVAAAFGLSALFVYSPLAFAIVKYCGAGYLVYLGIAGFLSGGIAGIDGRVAPGADQSGSRPCRRVARRADCTPPLLGIGPALVLERSVDRARRPAGVERPPLRRIIADRREQSDEPSR